MMLLGDVLLCGCRGPKGKVPLGVLTTTQVEHGEVAFATAMRPSIDSDGGRLATDIVLLWVKLRNTQHEPISSGLALKADIAEHSRHVSKVPP